MEKAAAVSIAVAIITLLVFSVIMYLDPTNVTVRSQLSETSRDGQRLVIIVGSVSLSVALLLTSLAWGIKRILNAFLVPPEDALYAASILFRLHRAPNEDGAQRWRATMKDVERVPGSAFKQLGDQPPPPVEETQEEVLSIPEFSSIYSAALPREPSLMVGVGNGGVQVYMPLRDFGGGIIGGIPSMGKSEAIASIIVGLLRQYPNGDVVKLLIADMKGNIDFGRIPSDLVALQRPVVSTAEEASEMVEFLWQEVQRRNRMIGDAGFNRIEAYNSKNTPLPYMFAFIDEIRVLTGPAMVSGSDRELRALSQQFIDRMTLIVSTGRAVGVGAVMATQRPTADVIPTSIRDVCSMRMAFKCMTSDSSKAVLGQGGAELLPREPGQALLVYQDQPTRVRTHFADIENGAFDRFMRTISRSELQVAVSRLEDTSQKEISDLSSLHDMTGPKEVIVPVSRAPQTVDEKRAIWLEWKRQGRSLSATEGALYKNDKGEGIKGGQQFYWVREAVEFTESRRGRRLSSLPVSDSTV